MNDSPINTRGATPGRRISIALAIAVHAALAVFLIYGIQWQTKSLDTVEVELVRAEPEPVAAVPPAPTIQPEPEPVPKPEPRPEPKPAPPPKPVTPPPKPDIAIKEKEKPKPPKKEEPKPVAKEDPKPRPDPFQEQLQRESERLTQRKAVDAATKELELAKASQAASARSKAVTDWIAKIKGKIRGNIVLPPEVKGNPEAIFDVTQLPSGEIIGVKLRKSSGVSTLDAAIERAILKSSPLPKPEQSELFSRSLELKFRPLEE
jgi:colicin import membrane protein